MYSNDAKMMAKQPVYNEQPIYSGQPVYGNFMYGDQMMQPQMMPQTIRHQQMAYDSSMMEMMDRSHRRRRYSDDEDDQFPTKLNGSRLAAKFYCKNCHSVETSFVEYELGTGAWVVCLLLCCYFPPYCFIPFCLDSCKDVVHECPNCRANVGTAKFLFE